MCREEASLIGMLSARSLPLIRQLITLLIKFSVELLGPISIYWGTTRYSSWIRVPVLGRARKWEKLHPREINKPRAYHSTTTTSTITANQATTHLTSHSLVVLICLPTYRWETYQGYQVEITKSFFLHNYMHPLMLCIPLMDGPVGASSRVQILREREGAGAHPQSHIYSRKMHNNHDAHAMECCG